ncbi:hypothetical protein N8150_02690 [Gammaproteobacteria bacterium]|nr:hypothetical protein [Gammaproteobacteria bacterium]
MTPPRSKKTIKKSSYIKESTRDLSNLRPVVNPDLKKRSDELMKALINNLNKNTLKNY